MAVLNWTCDRCGESFAENRTVHLFLIDYAYKQRVEITTRRASVRTRSRRRRPR